MRARFRALFGLLALALLFPACGDASMEVPDASRDMNQEEDGGDGNEDATPLDGADGLDAFDGEDGDGEDSDGEDSDGGHGDGEDSGEDGGDDGGGVLGWRSALLPEDWTPDFTDSEGRFLHDFSYAGYANGEEPLPVVEIPVLNVVQDFGADPSGQMDATSAFQDALDQAAAAGGGVVFVPAGLYRLDGLLSVRASHVILRGEGAAFSRLYFTRDEDMGRQAAILFQGAIQTLDELPLTADAPNRSRIVEVEDALDLAVGDDVELGWLISSDFVSEHGMDGTWEAFNGQWKPFFRRQVISIDRNTIPHLVELDVPLRYPALLRDAASLRRVTGMITGCAVEDLGMSNAIDYDLAWGFNQAHLITMIRVKDCWIRGVESFDSPSGEDDFHVQSGGILISASKRVTVADSSMAKAQHRGGGGNGYLFELRASSEVLFRDCQADAGRHNFIQNWDFGTTGSVFLRCASSNGRMLVASWDFIGVLGKCEYHHSLATANLVDSCQLADGWVAYNRHAESTGAGHTVTQSAFWNNHGTGRIDSMQYGWGYVIGINDLELKTSLVDYNAIGTSPEDWVESSPDGSPLLPSSLYEYQLQRRLAP